jgi:hemerythrin
MKKYLIKDVRTTEGQYEEYTLAELKEYFKIDVNLIDEEDRDIFEGFNIRLNDCKDTDDIKYLLDEFGDDFYSFEEVR